MKSLKNFQEQGFKELTQTALQHLKGGQAQDTNRTTTWTTCNEVTGCTETNQRVTTDYANGTSCSVTTWNISC